VKSIDYSAWRFWFDVFQFIGICGLGIYTWWTNRERVTNKKFKEHDQRLSALEKEISLFPSKKQYDALTDKIGGLHGDLKEISGQLKGLNRAVDLMNEYLINQGGKGR